MKNSGVGDSIGINTAHCIMRNSFKASSINPFLSVAIYHCGTYNYIILYSHIFKHLICINYATISSRLVKNIVPKHRFPYLCIELLALSHPYPQAFKLEHPRKNGGGNIIWFNLFHSSWQNRFTTSSLYSLLLSP